jgi:hypothetical protein
MFKYLHKEFNSNYYIMHNDCYNTIIITNENSHELNRLIDTEFGHFLTDNYTSNDNEKFYIYRTGDYGISFKLWSECAPDFEWLDRLLTKYQDVWIKNSWLSENGNAGIWVGTMRNGEKEIKRLDWQDMSIEQEMCTFSNW